MRLQPQRKPEKLHKKLAAEDSHFLEKSPAASRFKFLKK